MQREHMLQVMFSELSVKRLPTLFALKGEAKRLRDNARAAGTPLQHQAALNLVAQAHEFACWEMLKAAVERQPLPEPPPFLVDLQRGHIDARWGPEFVAPCFWSPKSIFFGQAEPWIEESTAHRLVAEFPAKFSMLGEMLQMRAQSGTWNSFFGPGSFPPTAAVFEGAALTLFLADKNEWGPVRATGMAAKVLEDALRNSAAGQRVRQQQAG